MRPLKSSFLTALLIVSITAIMTTTLAAAPSKTKVRMAERPVENGKITGKITDKETGEAVVGASIMVVGTQRGAMSDFDGKYTITQISPGTYTLRISNIGYNTLEVSQVVVKGGITSEQSFALEKETGEMQKTIKVVGRQDQLQVYESANQSSITRDEIQQKPVTTVDELLDQVAGITANTSGEVFMRGGRSGEVKMQPGQSAPSKIRRDESYGQPDATYCPPPGYPYDRHQYDAMFFQNYGTNPFVDTRYDHLSTFAIDTDDASYVLAKSYLERGALPPDDAVRVEEFINHFDYDYEAPRNEAFRVYAEGAPSQFGDYNTQLLQIGIKGREVFDRERKPANLVFVIDVSGSMRSGNRLELVKQALTMLVRELRSDDLIGIVAYNTTARNILLPTPVRNGRTILAALNRLQAGGSTNVEAGLRLGYQMAQRQNEQGCINRVILCSDGVANVGETSPEGLLNQIRGYANRGITLTAIGVGMGNYNDVLLEKLGDKGNGSYAYMNDMDDARKVFVEKLNGTLEVIARDVKIQVDFDPSVVRSYRLLGYENRNVADNQFRNDRVDGGEIGAGYQVTALYEVVLWKRQARGPLATVHVRFKEPEGGRATEVTGAIGADIFARSFQQASVDFRLAACAAQFSEILRHSYWARGERLDDVYRVVRELAWQTESEQVDELHRMIGQAMRFEDQLAER